MADLLTQLSDVKTILGIPSSDTSQDALLNLIISGISAQVESYCGRIFGVADYVDNLKAPNSQYLQLFHWPINTVASVVDRGTTLVQGTDYYLYPQYTAAGQLYRDYGWYPIMVTRGLTYDVYTPTITLVASYNAGYVLPGASPIAGVAALPADLQLCVQSMVAKVYGLTLAQNLGENFQSIKEGGLSYTFDNPAKIPPDLFQVIAGMPVQFAVYLNPYKAWVTA